MMKTLKKTLTCIVTAFLLMAAAGCGDAKREAAAKEAERRRLEIEAQAQADAAKANKAITTNNQKMFNRMNASSPGASTSEASATSSVESPAPRK